MLMMMSNSSSIAATKSITVRLSNSRSPAKVVASVIVDALLVERLDQRADAAVDFVAVHTGSHRPVQAASAWPRHCGAKAARRPLVKRRRPMASPSRRQRREVAAWRNRRQIAGQDRASSGGHRRRRPIRRTRSTCCARSQNNTLKLSQMADQKASILMGATFVVFSIAVSQALRRTPAVVARHARGVRLPQLAVRGARGAAAAERLAAARRRGATRCSSATSTISTRTRGPSTCSATCAADEAVFRSMLHDIYQNGQVLQQPQVPLPRLRLSAVRRRPGGHAGRVRGRVRGWPTPRPTRPLTAAMNGPIDTGLAR